MANRKLHYLVLVGAITLGIILRFWHLDLKPLWLDEVITALFSLGRNYNDVPLEAVFSVKRLEQIFSFNPAVSCSQIAHNLATQSTHPPLFFCLMHKWLGIHVVGVLAHGLVWMRSLSALFGVSVIAAVYYLNRVAFAPAAGLMGAAMMAVSPFGVYLSQEARHYTLPMLLITLALLGLIQIQQDLFQQQQLRFSVWTSWAIVNSIGLYVHYFFILAFIAQIVTLFGLLYWRGTGILPAILIRKSWLIANLAVIAIVASFIPWYPMLLGHFNRSETKWLPQPQHITPVYQTLASWVLMIVALPVENQPLWFAVPSGLLMVFFAAWVTWHTVKGLKQLWHTPENNLSVLTLGSFTLCVLLEFFAITYLLGKDLTFIPRYHFVYYPSLLALIAASLVKERLVKSGPKAAKQNFYLLFFTSCLSCVLVVSNFVFQKPYNPQLVAQNMNQEPAIPLMVVVGYQDYQDIALGLSFALALEKIRSDAEFAFFKRSLGYEYVWQKLSQLQPPAKSQLNLWVVAPELKRRDYPSQLKSTQNTCTLDSTQHYRIGIPYQLYQCGR